MYRATALVSIPATVLNGVLNGGYGPDLSTVINTGLPGVPLYAGGLLTSFGINLGDGPLGFTVNLPGPVAALQLLHLGPEVEALVKYYRQAAGEHPDWDEYRAVMVSDRRVLMAMTVDRVYGAKLR